ncbi:MAG: hypothetical protein IPL75_12775 [Acidobacteria bacterium]|nr:hypothetical protein [Acidobacteriota bacterium]
MSSAIQASLFAILVAMPAAAHAQLVVLSPTHEVRDDLPVLRRHEDPSRATSALTRGFSGRLLRLYALEQEFLRQKTGRVPEPAYLVLSNRQGGFPQFGFYLDDEKKAGVGWVDLHRNSRLTGRFGAVDQIFPHELLHVIAHQLAGEPRRSGGNQMHAVGVRSDPVNAFAEGFAEHAQILAIDDEDADDETKRLRDNAALRVQADHAVETYTRDLTRSWWPIQPSRMRFMLWWGQAEQVQRYHAVKANLFARTPAIPPSLLAREDKYRAYLVQNVVPGTPQGPARPAGVMMSIDGAVAHLFWRLVTDTALQARYRDGEFYASFGTSADRVSPLENVYLKIFAVLYAGRPSTAADTVRSWSREFPEDAPDIERVTREALLGQRLPDAAEIWLANDAFITGTSLFDQYRGLPRPHTFDANAATELDWLTVPGATPAIAAQFLAAAPYATLDDLLARPSLTTDLRARIMSMSATMTRLQSRATDEEESLSLSAIVTPYLWRLGALAIAATVAGAWLSRFAGVRRTWAAALVSLASTLIVIALAWIVTSPAWYPFAAPALLGGAPWGLWRLARRARLAPALQPLAIWTLAAVPALILTYRW